jgi:hypothetical protein
MKLPKVETLILLAFLGCVALWAISKCSGKRSDLVRRVRELDGDEREERPVRRDTVVATNPAPTPTPSTTPAALPPASAAPTTVQPPPQPGARPQRPTLSNSPASSAASPPPAASTKNSATLYATIEGLKVRKEPGLKSETLATLELYEPVTFLNQKTEWTQEISLGYEKVTDHWVKVRTKSGKIGWVFGAGVHYYKMKRKGVMD